MILNLLVLAYVILMIYWWGNQGLFSAFLHLIAVIVAGALAFAIWEPLTLGWLIDRMPPYSWGVGLVAPFILALIIIRVALDKAVPANLYFSTLVNWIGGGLLGLFSGVLTAGIAVLGIGFLFNPPDFAGVMPYMVDTTGEIVDNPTSGGVWLGVDARAAGFFRVLSGGAFASSTPMALYQPDLATQAALFRMRYDPNASVIASPRAVEATAVGVFALPLKGIDDAVSKALGEPARVRENKIVVIDTKWTATAGTFDADSTLRLYPTQVRLVTVSTGDSTDAEPQLVAPVGVALGTAAGDGDRVYLSLRDTTTHPTADQRGATMGWVFIVPADRTPRFLLVRHLRLPLPEELKLEPAAAAGMIGYIGPSPNAKTLEPNVPAPGTSAETPPTPTVGAQVGLNPGAAAAGLELSDALPLGISMNMASSLNYDKNVIRDGKADVAPPTGFVPPGVKAEKIVTFPTQASVRMLVDQQKAQSLLGATRVAAASLGGVWLEDKSGTQYKPIGYVLYRAADQVQEININRDQPVESAKQLPVQKMAPNDKLYLYFALPHKVQVTKIQIGSAAQEANLAVP